jgi:hypothetical protein
MVNGLELHLDPVASEMSFLIVSCGREMTENLPLLL